MDYDLQSLFRALKGAVEPFLFFRGVGFAAAMAVIPPGHGTSGAKVPNPLGPSVYAFFAPCPSDPGQKCVWGPPNLWAATVVCTRSTTIRILRGWNSIFLLGFSLTIGPCVCALVLFEALLGFPSSNTNYLIVEHLSWEVVFKVSYLVFNPSGLLLTMEPALLGVSYSEHHDYREVQRFGAQCAKSERMSSWLNQSQSGVPNVFTPSPSQHLACGPLMGYISLYG